MRFPGFIKIKKFGRGCVYLFPGYDTEPPLDPDTDPGFANVNIYGVLVRETWERLYQDGYGTFNWTWLDKCLARCDSTGKFASLEILAGNFSPSAFFESPINGRYIISGPPGLKTTVPWDPVFQSEWRIVQQALFDRYGHRNIFYNKIGGPGHGSESFFATKPDELEAADSLAIEMGYADCDHAWRAGVTALIDMHVGIWTTTFTTLVTGIPYDRDGGTGALALQAMFDYGESTYRGIFTARADDLYSSTSPPPGDISSTVIHQLSLDSPAGFQMGNSKSDPADLDGALNNGTGIGAHFIEIFAGNVNGSQYQAAMIAANARMLAA